MSAMHMKSTKWILIFLLLFMTGCNRLSPPLPAVQPEDPEIIGQTHEPYAYTLYCNYHHIDVTNRWGEDKVSAALKEKFNIDLKLVKPEGDPLTMLNVMLFSNELPEAIMMDRNSHFLRLIGMKKLIELDPYIEKYPHYKSVIPPHVMELSRVDGKVYGILNWSADANHPTGGNFGWVINEQIHKELGSPPLEDTDDLFQYLLSVKDSSLSVDGNPVIPMQFGHNILVTMMYASFGATYPGNFLYKDDDNLRFYFNDPRLVDAMLYLNKLWRHGLMDQGYFIEKNYQIQEKMSNGEVAVYAGFDLSTHIGMTARLRLKEKNPENDYQVIFPIPAPGIPRHEVKGEAQYSTGWNAISITSQAEKPERIFELHDYMISNEGQRLLIYGPEGEMYDLLDASGYPILHKTESDLSEREKKELGIWMWNYPGDALYVDKSKYAADNRKPVENRDWTIQAQINIISKAKFNADEYLNIFIDTKSEAGNVFSTCKTYIEYAIPRIIMAKSAEESLNLLQEAVDHVYRMGFEIYETEYTRIWRENNK